MYRELVSALTSEIEWVKIQPPCPEEELQQAEQAVGYAFPAELRAMLREMNGDRWCLLSAREIIENVERNRKYYRPLFETDFTPEDYTERVDRFIFFATNGCGDYYGYRVRPDGAADGTEIDIWEHEELGEPCCWHRVAGNLAEFITRYYHSEI